MCVFVGCRGLLVLSIAAACCWIAAGQDWSAHSDSSSSSDFSGVVRDLPCLDERGKIVLHGYPYWIDECSNCVCDNGTLLCQYKSCKPLPCSQSERINLEGVCCDICPNNDIVNVGAPTVSPDTSKKQDSVVSDLPCLFRGRIFRHGEVAQIDNCLNCVCHNSTMSCQFVTCPPLTCRDRIGIEGVCCHVCPNNDIVNVGAPTVSPDTSKKQDDIVNVGAPTVSPDTSKKQDVVANDLPCIYGEQVANHGQDLAIDDCTPCVCDNSTLMCQFKKCPPLRCSHGQRMIKLEGVCCEICSDISTTPVPEDVDGDDSPLQPLLLSILETEKAQLKVNQKRFKFERDHLDETREMNKKLANIISIMETRA